MDDGCRDADPDRCAEAAAALQHYLDAEVDREQARVIAEHLDACRGCGLEYSTWRALKAAVERSDNALDPECVTRLREFAARLTSD